MSYTATANSRFVSRDADGAIVPVGVLTTHSEAYATWLAAGNTPTPYTPQPAAPIAISYLQFRALFSAAENQAIMMAAQTDHAVLDWLLQAVGAAPINLGDASVKAGLDALVAAGLLTATRETAILANQAPQVS